jgi:antitoxin FitA
MPSIQIKNVPPEVHETLQRRAQHSHQSLQEYLLQRLISEAEAVPMNEVLEQLEREATGSMSFDEAVALIRAERDSH